jgi:hypothetical protein
LPGASERNEKEKDAFFFLSLHFLRKKPATYRQYVGALELGAHSLALHALGIATRFVAANWRLPQT